MDNAIDVANRVLNRIEQSDVTEPQISCPSIDTALGILEDIIDYVANITDLSEIDYHVRSIGRLADEIEDLLEEVRAINHDLRMSLRDATNTITAISKDMNELIGRVAER